MNIVCRIDKSDVFKIDDEASTVDFFDPMSFSYTFWNNHNKLPNWYSRQALDLLYISLAVFAADRLCQRDNAYDGWSRDFLMFVPVMEYDIWTDAKQTLEEMLSFLSGDSWKFVFRKREESENEKTEFKRWNKSKKHIKDYDQLCMFSGGLDSFIGAIDLLEKKVGKTLFISHYGGGKGTKEFQDALKNSFIEQYLLEERDFHQYYATVIAGVEDTTRTRSFMFFSHALAVASCFQKPIRLIIPENGFISLNIPSTFSRIGTSSTRTTHPYYMTLFQKLLSIIELPVTLVNPYQFKTKGEMILECKNIELLKENIDKTMSCSHPDAGRMFKEVEAKHCGYCLPCIVRRASIKKGIGIDKTEYRDKDFKKHKVAKENLNSYLLGIKRYNKNSAIMKIQLSGEIKENINLYADLYNRGIDELKAILEDYYE